jgi:hypothetical protein
MKSSESILLTSVYLPAKERKSVILDDRVIEKAWN